MRKIPKGLLAEMLADPFYLACCITGELGPELHHSWTYGGQQINEKWAILPLSSGMHRLGKMAVHRGCLETRELIQYLSLTRATPEDLAKYPKKNWNQLIDYYKNKYGENVQQAINDLIINK